MNESHAFLRHTELDRTTFSDLRERMAQAESLSSDFPTRRYPGYPSWPLLRVRPGRFKVSLERALCDRRCVPALGTAAPDHRTLSRLLQSAHGITAISGRGPTPSAGSLQALELYLVHWTESWLPVGLYHYDRRGHHLAQVASHADRTAWEELVPSLLALKGGALLWVLVGDESRVAAKYGDRAGRFLLLEAGHLMQSLCLLSTTLDLCTIPLGGSFERAIAGEFALPVSDSILYTGVCGPTRRDSIVT